MAKKNTDTTNEDNGSRIAACINVDFDGAATKLPPQSTVSPVDALIAEQNKEAQKDKTLYFTNATGKPC